ncbi:hypothetical protein SKAU_G00091610 [Synaphobranchus kaupii]|uniref:Integrase core domain-containing protein n=1 Tax=Synaphobranchus kaupii TaxID=118154 RepID=A0A9Q1FXM5_SYNKA|nr:hypothetical protein SKAU_G00091610 [Synaphobranchus kaupii]
MMNPDEEMDLFALHWIYVPQVQKHLQTFKEAWNHHKMRTEGNQTPMQLWLSQPREGNEDDPTRVDNDYGIDWTGSHNPYSENVTVPQTQLPHRLTEADVAMLPNPDIPLSAALHGYCKYSKRNYRAKLEHTII